VVRVVPVGSASEAARRLREGDPPLVVRIHRDALWLDPRTLADEDLEVVAGLVAGLSR
jgi:seryl-tRNA(Sec) selenium transferase